ncbi:MULTISPECIES: hemin uptake protein HemP [Alcanivoracaceae]|uniref:Hemin uptake protein, putative n=4 Tax=Alcanivoracaceae TaxID=224372 RepID=K0C8G3_ALCDB|nr:MULTISPECIES: hemin uptake protein HemP [Alcanivoracaceae]ERS10579.1 hemin transporter [Alcanivorax sp. PN-3]KYZ84657.1 hemin transporter [Alcanivorax sp. KX64203]MBA4720851.1 hemin uptake protein HemP [Alcanivorax sp.]AFT68760.1 Hemin uptake protein, putative [Alloalcanivorax dieselolei B5]ARB44373.1 hemin transporter [Alloalcanivorax xenomutans]
MSQWKKPVTIATRSGRRIAVQEDSVASRALLNADGKLWIEHGGERYLLRRTANDRLILTK